VGRMGAVLVYLFHLLVLGLRKVQACTTSPGNPTGSGRKVRFFVRHAADPVGVVEWC